MTVAMTPKWNAGLRAWLRRLGTLFAPETPLPPSRPEPQTAATTTLRPEIRHRLGYGLWDEIKVTDAESPYYQPSRVDWVDQSRRLFDIDARVQGVVEMVLRDILRVGWSWKLNEDLPMRQQDTIRAKLEDLEMRLDLSRQITAWLESVFVDGDLFLQIVIDGRSRRVLKVLPLSTLHMERLSNDYDEFDDPNNAFIRREWPDTFGEYQWQREDSGTPYAAWEILHVRWGQMPRRRYGRPLLAAGLANARSAKRGEFDMAIRRAVRAGMKLHHQIGADSAMTGPVTDRQIREYLELNKTALDNPYASAIDFFSNAGTTISPIQGDANLSDIDDIKHHVDTFFVQSPVPKPLLGYSDDINRDVLGKSQEQYRLTLEDMSRWVAAELLHPLLWRCLLIEGTQDGTYIQQQDLTCEFGSRGLYDAEQFAQTSDSVLKLVNQGLLSQEGAWDILERELPHFDREAERERLEDMAWEQAQMDAALDDADEDEDMESGDDGDDTADDMQEAPAWRLNGFADGKRLGFRDD